MNANRIIEDIRGLVNVNQTLQQENEELRQRKISAEKFYAATLTIEAVASLHGIHPNTVRKYVAAGLINRHPSSMDGKILIRASEALLLDFSQLRKKSHSNI